MTPRVLVAVPVYNHAPTLRAVVLGLLERHPHVLVVDDGSDDLEPEVLAGLLVRPASVTGKPHLIYQV